MGERVLNILNNQGRIAYNYCVVLLLGIFRRAQHYQGYTYLAVVSLARKVYRFQPLLHRMQI
jgi:hypothetical protein